MEELVGGIIFIAFALWLISTGMEWIASHPSEIAQHILNWKELYALLAFLTYLIVIRVLTQKVFSEASHHEPGERKSSLLGASGGFIVRAVVFFLVTVLIWVRSQFLLTAIHYEHAEGLAKVVLAALLGLIFAFWPTSSLSSITYSVVLAHLRGLYLVVATLISIASLTLAAIVSGVIIALAIALYAALVLAVMHLIGEPINLNQMSHILIIIGGIAIFIMTARGTWSLARYMFATHVQGIQAGGLKVLQAWRGICQGLYAPISRLPLRLGSFLGGDAT